MEWQSSHGERGQHPRFMVKLALDYSETPNVVRGGLVANISEAGLRSHSVHPIQIGTELNIRVYAFKGEYTIGSIEGRGKIIWSILHRERDWKGYRYGLYLTEMPLDDRQRLIHFLKPLQGNQENPLDNSYPKSYERHNINGEKEHATWGRRTTSEIHSEVM